MNSMCYDVQWSKIKLWLEMSRASFDVRFVWLLYKRRFSFSRPFTLGIRVRSKVFPQTT